ncbi:MULTISPECIES: carbohydrate ABC transporter permease [Caldilinea]|jgi:multiple sugar transport system permease protein|uniref:carbohydrate ABC transporter permease n=1 Tax=Caldilinea TaxID=233191 RepID=UPI00031F3E04|nr:MULTISPECIES: sugar ABC transporter permease [Caldilinea]MBO9391750.1 sugar ABC transporter permease [Caldilinea sp.]GIV72874.1 MAG: sugar ABC transporter permease [Caldilinea sp.]
MRILAPANFRVSVSTRKRVRWTPLLFLAPYLFLFITLRLAPSAIGLFISFTNWSAIGAPKWVGLANYQALLIDPRFRDALTNTVIFTAMAVPALVGLGLAFALFLNQPYQGRGLGRVAVFTPYVIMPTVVGVLWTWILEKDFGLLNVLLGRQIPWLVSPSWAMLGLVLAAVWSMVGYNTVLFLAGLQDIPSELYEAARIDGASAWRSFWSLTLPLLAPTAFLVLMLTFINTFQVFDLVYVMTSGGPGTSTLTLVQYVYTTAFQFFKFGYGSAVAMVIFVILVIIALIQTRAYRRGLESIY